MKGLLYIPRGRGPGPSGISTDLLTTWWHNYDKNKNNTDANTDTDTDTDTNKDATTDTDTVNDTGFCTMVPQWLKVEHIAQHAFRTGYLPSQLTRQLLIMLPKAPAQYRRIGLVDAVWKLCNKVINDRLKQYLDWHGQVHGFRAEHGTSTAIMEVKLLSDAGQFRGNTLFKVFLDLQKAFDSVDRSRVLEVLPTHGVGIQIIMLIENYWKHQDISLRMGR